MQTQEQTHVVYKIVDKDSDEVVYVGCGTPGRPRMSLVHSHIPQIKNNCKNLRLLVSDVRFDRDTARYVEWRFICKYKPRFNKRVDIADHHWPDNLISGTLPFREVVGYRTPEQVREALILGSKLGGYKFSLVKSERRLFLDKELKKALVYLSRATKSGDPQKIKAMALQKQDIQKKIESIEKIDNPNMTRVNGRMTRV